MNRSVMAVAMGLGLMAPQMAFAASGDKGGNTPTFCQTDPTAHFKGAGDNYCAPTAVSDGLMYLATARHYTKLAPRADHDGQVALIKALSDKMGTDPSNGTGPGGIINGLQAYVQGKHYTLARVEYAGWRKIGSSNQKFIRGAQPQLAWLQSAANNPDTVVLFNVGWYRPVAGGFKRTGGHWVDVLGSDGRGHFTLRNPSLKVERQDSQNNVTLTALDRSFKTVSSPGAPATLAGYYKVSGPGLPSGKSIPVLDCAMVFRVGH